MLVPEIYGVADAIALATRIRACLTEPFAIEDRPVVMTCSVGVAVGHGHEADFESLLQRADGAMYDAKGLGRDTFVVDSPALTETRRRRVAMSSDLHHAIDRNELTISYQPQIRLDTGGSSESKPSFDGSTPRSARSAPMSSWSSTGGSGGLRSRRFDRGSTQVWNPSGSRSTSRRVTYAIRTFQRS